VTQADDEGRIFLVTKTLIVAVVCRLTQYKHPGDISSGKVGHSQVGLFPGGRERRLPPFP